MTTAATILADFPSPTEGAWHLGPIPIRAYAMCILLGIVAACLITEVRLRRRGAPKWLTLDISLYAVPAGIIGARIYHLITSPDDYFGADGDPMRAFRIWEGGLGIWGAVAGGALGAWYACRRVNLPLTVFADALAPGLPVAQAIGRVGNWFNNELYGGHTDLPWGLKVYEYDLSAGRAVVDPATGEPVLVSGGPFHPTFLYEAGWNLGVALLVWLVDRRWKLGRGRAFALYVMGYTAGRFWIEALRTDTAHEFFGMRVNNWVSIAVFLGALAYFVLVRGPQEHISVAEDGSLSLVTADGTPIDWRNRRGRDTGVGSTGPAQAGPDAETPDEQAPDGQAPDAADAPPVEPASGDAPEAERIDPAEKPGNQG
ncbi:prolipoprotein diacylglyceryl transferase [Luedemannella helvata]|uniref:Phosphatidylglycerol--prolipoprotein diacylglyceryl transferase n=1 Tax=Luedemannella helvata TaxID=349315 RepID=A0ABP4WNL9_9ACTN